MQRKLAVIAAALFVIQGSFGDEVMATIPYVSGRLAQQRISY